LLLLSKFIIIKKKFEYQTFQKKCLITYLPGGRQGLRIDYADLKCIEHKENFSNHFFFEIPACGRQVCNQESSKLLKISDDKKDKIG
jgi:hypothetical protein